MAKIAGLDAKPERVNVIGAAQRECVVGLGGAETAVTEVWAIKERDMFALNRKVNTSLQYRDYGGKPVFQGHLARIMSIFGAIPETSSFSSVKDLQGPYDDKCFTAPIHL